MIQTGIYKKTTYLMKMGLYNKSVKSKADHKFLCRLWWAVTPQAYSFFIKRFTFALCKPCPLFLCF